VGIATHNNLFLFYQVILLLSRKNVNKYLYICIQYDLYVVQNTAYCVMSWVTWVTWVMGQFPLSFKWTSSEQWWLSGGQEGKLAAGLFCAPLCATIVHSELHTHMSRPNSSLDWVLSHWAHFTVLRFIFVYVLFSVWLYIACMCSIVTWWGGPGGTEAWSLRPLLSLVLWHCWLGHLTRKTHPRYDLWCV